MKNLSFLLPCCLLVLLAGPVQAVVRSSTAYSTSIEALDAGGGAPGSAGYAQSVTGIGLIGGVQSSAAYNGHTGYVPQTSSPGSNPSSGTMALTPDSPFDPSTELTVSFAGWYDDDLPLSYAVLIDNVVVSPQGSSAMRNITGPSTPGTYTLKGRIYDALGGYTEVVQGFTVNNPQQTWRQTYFGTTSNTGNAADSHDYDKDGLVNLIEWAAGLNPTTASTHPVTTVHNGAFFEFTYTRSVSAVQAGAVFTVEWSDTLPGTSWTSAGVAEQILSDNGTVQHVKATIPAGSAGRRFVHLKVAAP